METCSALRAYISRLLSLLAVAASVSSTAHAQVYAPHEALVDRSAMIVTARVTAIDSGWDRPSRTIVSLVSLDVIETLRGPAYRAITLRQLGGAASDLVLQVHDQARFHPEEVALLFLEPDLDGVLHTVGLGAGKWTWRDNPATGTAEVAPDPMASDARWFTIDEMRALASSRPARPVPLVAAPPRGLTATLHPEPSTRAETRAPLPTSGDPARWHEADDGVAIGVDAGTLPSGWTGSSTTMAAAAAAWSTAGSTLTLSTPGSGANTCPTAFTGSGRIAIAFAPDACASTDWVLAGGYYTAGEVRTVGGTSFQKLVQGFVIVAGAGAHTTASGCLQDAVAHGLGHAVGLGHTTAVGNLMEATPSASCATAARPLGTDDVASLRTVYAPAPSSGQAPSAPTSLTATAQDGAVTMTWTPGAGGGVVQSHVVEAGSAPGLSNLATLVTTATPSYRAAAVPAGSYWLRVRARNALGTSAPSAEVPVVVAPCRAPATPANFSATAQGASAMLAWSAPADTSTVTGYRLEVGTSAGASNLITVAFPAGTTAYSASGPPGIYFLRLRSVNGCGTSPPTADVALTLRTCVGAPGAPTALLSTVTQRVVTLAWTAPAEGETVQQYVVVAGSVPGAADLLTLPLTSMSSTYQATAPPGTYYVRVVSRNDCGDSLPSPERQIVVQ